MNLITDASKRILEQLLHFVEQLTPQQYANSLDILSNNSISKHIRHILEFYICLFDGLADELVNYDHRQRDVLLETSQEYTCEVIAKYINLMEKAVVEDKKLFLEVLLSAEGGSVTVPTTLFRELAYNIEHAIHHMAILKIAVKQVFQEVELSPEFGIAYSTIKHQQTQSMQK